jgi:putative glutamine amidotransferase
MEVVNEQVGNCYPNSIGYYYYRATNNHHDGFSEAFRMIGIVAKTFIGETSTSVGVTAPYVDYFSDWGDVMLLSPMKLENFEKILPLLDLVVLPGGQDVNPLNYGAIPSSFSGSSNPYLEYFDQKMLPLVFAAKIPVFGICRGLQTLNVAFGGTLIQNINHPTSAYRTQDAHSVKTEKPLALKFKVNSMHHQAVNMLGAGLEVIATSEDGFIEAIKHQSLPIAAVQWHPEEIWDQYTSKLIDNLLGKE